MTDDSDRPREPILNPRGALILLISILVATGAAALTRQATGHLAEAILVGVAAFAASVKFIDWLIA